MPLRCTCSPVLCATLGCRRCTTPGCIVTAACRARRAYLLLTCCLHPVVLLPSVLTDMSRDGLLNIYGLTRTLVEQNDDFETTIQVGCTATGPGLGAVAAFCLPFASFRACCLRPLLLRCPPCCCLTSAATCPLPSADTSEVATWC